MSALKSVGGDAKQREVESQGGFEEQSNAVQQSQPQLSWAATLSLT